MFRLNFLASHSNRDHCLFLEGLSELDSGHKPAFVMFVLQSNISSEGGMTSWWMLAVPNAFPRSRKTMMLLSFEIYGDRKVSSGVGDSVGWTSETERFAVTRPLQKGSTLNYSLQNLCERRIVRKIDQRLPFPPSQYKNNSLGGSGPMSACQTNSERCQPLPPNSYMST